MAQRIEMRIATIPAGTPVAAPVDVPTTFDVGIVERVEILVPPGPSGLMGFQITHSGVTIIPHEPDQWIITDDEKIPWDLADFPTGAAWGVRAYNLDVFDHTIYLRFLIREIGALAPIEIQPLGIEQADQGAVVPEDTESPEELP